MNLNMYFQNKKQSLEVIKWLIIILLLTITIMGNYFYSDIKLYIRTIIDVIIIITASILVSFTNKGRRAITFAHETRCEMYKIIWPTKQEALYTTLIVTIVTALISLILWGLDIILIHIISFITNMRF